MEPGDGGRKWVKLWVSDWLDGTTRYQMNGAQRAFWIDLLAMAGRGRVGGIVCSGKDGNKLIGYPIEKFQSLSPSEPLDVLKTLKLFERTGKIKIEVEKNDFGLTLYVIHIVSWHRYQSEYERIKKYRGKSNNESTEKVHEKSQPKSQKSNTTEVEVEVEEEEEGEGEGEGEGGGSSDDDPPASLPANLPPKPESLSERLTPKEAAVRFTHITGCPVPGDKATRERLLDLCDTYGTDLLRRIDSWHDINGHEEIQRRKKWAFRNFCEVVDEIPETLAVGEESTTVRGVWDIEYPKEKLK